MSAIVPALKSHLLARVAKPSLVISTRAFSPKSYPMDDGTYRGERPVRFGYEAHHHEKGLLPRLKIKEKCLPWMPRSGKEDPWSDRQATMGKNDFVKILGNPEIEQYELLDHIPDWLRGYKDTHKEYNVLLRKKKEFEHWKYTKPLKWTHLENRLRFLYKHLNNKYKPPNVEKLNPSRHQL